MKVFDPTAGPETGGFELAARLGSLRGKVVGLLDNTKTNSDRLLRLVGRLLQEKHGVAALIERRKFTASMPASDELVAELARQCDVVIAGIGD
ncbi:MAG: hypothetical protein HYY96_08305 [Candidatus Tectomicrobia bacterium]|nr:hypothetical protein [Candidatus Tectomicrobia bacterium]